MSDSTGVRTTRCNTGCLDVSSNMFPQTCFLNLFPQTCFLKHVSLKENHTLMYLEVHASSLWGPVVAMATFVRRPFSNPDL